MSSCISGGGRAYQLETLDLEIIKSPSSTSWISNSSSPSSTLCESRNSPLAISTRKPRTPRKRPNQTYNEAQALLSTAYPKLFPTTKHLININNPFLFEPSDLLNMPFRVIHNSGFLLLETPNNSSDADHTKGLEKSCQSPGEINSEAGITVSSEICEDEQYQCQADFDAESMLDEEIGEGIDSIMGILEMENEPINKETPNCCYGYPVGLGFEFGFGMRREIRAMRHDADEGDWWSFPCVNVLDITPNIAKINPADKKKKNGLKIKNSETIVKEKSNSAPRQFSKLGTTRPAVPQPNAGLLLKLNYDTVLNAWSDKGSPFSADAPPFVYQENDVQARLVQIDLFSENGGIREASVLRYKEKRRSRLFYKKIRHQVRKVNVDRRLRMKGRFVRMPSMLFG